MKTFKFGQNETIELLILVAILVNLYMAVNGCVDISSNIISAFGKNKQFTNWIDSMPEGYTIVGRTFSSNLDIEEIEKIVNDYFSKNEVYKFRVYLYNKKEKRFSVEYIVKVDDSRELADPLIKLINAK